MAGRSRANVEAGRATVRVIADNKQAYKNLRRMERRFQKFGQRIQNIAGSIAAAFAGRAAIGGILNVAQIAGDAQIIERRFQLLFRNVSTEAAASAQEFSTRYNTALVAVQDQFARARALLTPLALGGATESQLLTLTQNVATIIQDFSVLAGVSMEEAQARITSALTSTGEAVDQYGINVRAAAIESQLLAMGINKTVQQATEEEKLLAKIAILRRSLNDQQIKATDSLGLYNVQIGRLRKNIEGLTGEIGSALLPAMTAVAAATNSMLQSLTAFFDKYPMLSSVIIGLLAGGAIFVAALSVLSVIGAAVGIFAAAAAALGTAGLGLLVPGMLMAGAAAGGGVAGTVMGTGMGRVRKPFSETTTWRAVAPWEEGAAHTSMIEDWMAGIGLRTTKFVPVRTRIEEREEDVFGPDPGGTFGMFAGRGMENAMAFGGAGADIQSKQLGKLTEVSNILDRWDRNGLPGEKED